MAEGARRVGPSAAGVVETEIDGRVALFLPGADQAVLLNETASDIWRLSDGEHTLDELVALLARAYRTKPRSIRADVEATLATLREQGFLQETG